MAILERMIQEIYPDKWEELDEIEKRYAVVEDRLGYPPKKRYNSFAAPYPANTLIIEREWSSMAEMEATYGRAFEDPEIQALNAEVTSIVKGSRFEFYGVRT